MTYRGTTLVGIVGYTPVVEIFPLGPRLMTALKDRFCDAPQIVVENMTWGPMHIVQRFQEEGVERPDRLVLVGAAAVCRHPGRVEAKRWIGGHLPEQDIQERVYEAVTGIVDIENTLIIGDYFEIWPDECFTVEADLQADAFGRMVVAEAGSACERLQLEAELGFSFQGMTDRIAEVVGDVAVHGAGAGAVVSDKAATGLAQLERFTVNHVVAEAVPRAGATKDAQ